MAVIGAIIGDMIGGPFEFAPDFGQSTDFPLFTYESQFSDDTVMTLAVGQGLIDCEFDEARAPAALANAMRFFAKAYPPARGGYRRGTLRWLLDRSGTPGTSAGNGSAMRVSAVGWLFDTVVSTAMRGQFSGDVDKSKRLSAGLQSPPESATITPRRSKARKPRQQRSFWLDRGAV